jgi:hypothetical protein
MNSKLLLKPLDNGFNYSALKEIESLCSGLLVDAPSNESPFIFIIRQICFDVSELIDSIDGSLTLHGKIEQSILPALTEIITSLVDETISNKLNKAHNLIGALRHIKKEINNLL